MSCIRYSWAHMGDYLDVTVDTPTLIGKFCITTADIDGFSEDLEDGFRKMLKIENYIENNFLGRSKLYDIRFKTAEAVYNMIIDNIDLYCEDRRIYLFHYNEDDAICYYSGLSREEAEKVAKEAVNAGEYWGSVISRHGYIIDEPSAAIAFCENLKDERFIPTNAFERMLGLERS